MEGKKRKRAQDEDLSISANGNAGKKAKYDHLFSTHANHLDSEARATYIASRAAQDVLAAIARGDANAINAGQAPPELNEKSQRRKWRDVQRRLALQKANTSSSIEQQEPPTKIEHSPAVSKPIDSDAFSKEDQREQRLALISRDQIIDVFFAGVACQLDDTAAKTFLASPEAEHVITAILRGDEDAIHVKHAPPSLPTKHSRRRWKQEQRLFAQRQRDIVLTNSTIRLGEATRAHSGSSSSIDVTGKSSMSEDHNRETTHDVNIPTSAPSSKATTRPSQLEIRSAGFTALVRPPVKVWNQPDGSMSALATNRVTKSTTPKPTTEIEGQGGIKKGALDLHILKQPPRTHTAVSARAAGLSSRRSSHASQGTLHRVQSRESASHVVPRRLHGDRNFDAPDYFARGSLADTERRFEAWARAQRGGRSDSSDSSSDEESEDDEAPSPKPVLRGSFHGSLSDRTEPKSARHPAKANSEVEQPRADEVVSESSESSEDEDEGEDEEEDDADPQTQLSKELQEATNNPIDEVVDDSQESPAAPAEVTVHVPDSQNIGDPSVGAELSAGNPDEMSARRTIDSSAIHKSKVQLPAPDQQAPGTPHGHPNAIRQANVRIKRILSQTDPGGNQSGHGLSETVKAVPRSSLIRSGRQAVGVTSHEDRVDHGELSDDVYDAIDDVTSDLMGSTKENIPSMDECKPDDSNGQDMDHVLTTGSAIETPDLGEREDLTEEPRNARAGAEARVRVKDEGEVNNSQRAKHKDSEAGQNEAKESPKLRRRTTSNSSSLSELSRTPSLPSEPQVIIPIHVPETPEMKREDSAKKKRKMTGNSSKHFGTGKRTRSGRKSSTLDDELAVRTPAVRTPAAAEVESSSVYVTAVSRRTRSAFKAPDVAEAEAIDTSDGEGETSGRLAATAERIPSTAVEETLETQASTSVHAAGEDAADTDVLDKEPQAMPKTRPTDTQSPEPETPFLTPQEPAATLLPSTPQTQPTKQKKPPRPKSKSTGRISNHFITDRVDLYNTTSTTPSKRLAAGLSRVPIPPTSAPTFGLIQEKLYREPFWLLIAVTFLNKTAGRSAVPIFWKLKEKYKTAEALAEADQEELLELVHRLGLQNQRSKRLIKIAKAWSEDPPVKGRRFRTLNYPCVGDGKAKDVPKVVEEDATDCTGALEIGHIPGCGEYAWDSWRIFCRDVLRGVADDYIGTNAESGFEPEWKRVLPKDKELRACLRWMWVKEGYIWDPLTGDRRPVTDDERDKADRGEMEIWDPGEAKFAVQAAAATAGEEAVEVDNTPSKVGTAEVERLEAQFASSDGSSDGDGQDEDEGEPDTIHVTPRRPPNRAAKVSRSVEQDDDDEKAPVSEPTRKPPKSTTAKSSKRKARTSSFRGDDEEENEMSKSKDGAKKRRSRRFTTA